MPDKPSEIAIDAIMKASGMLCLFRENGTAAWIASPGLAKQLGLADDWIPWDMNNIQTQVHREDLARFLALLASAEEGCITPPEVIRVQMQDKSWCQISCASTVTPAGPVIVMHDVSTATQVESAFLDSQTRLNGLYNGTPVSIILWSKEGRIVGWNTKAEETFGYSRDTVIGKKLTPLLIAPTDYLNFSRSVSEALADNKGTDTICKTLKADGQIMQCRWRSVPMRNRKGGLTGLLSMAQDVTAELAAAAAMQMARDEAERLNRAKSEFLAVVSHELRTPLNGILGMSQLLESYDLDAGIKPLVGDISASGRKLLDIVTAMLDYAKADLISEADANRQFSLFELLALGLQGHEFRAGKKGLAFSLEIDPQIPDSLYGDESALNGLLAALCDNAVRFTESGEVKVIASLLSQEIARVRIQLDVADTGIGMSEEFIAQLYTPFRQAESAFVRQHGGVGLGLALTKKLVDRLHGSIAVDSQPGQGTRFTVQVDLRRAG